MTPDKKMNTIEAEMRDYLSKYVMVRTLLPDSSLFEAGFMTSLFAAQLITFVETHFEIRIPDDELEMRNFATIAAISSLIERLRSASSSLE